MSYNAKDYIHLLGTEGFSETLLKNHFTLYQGYVTNANKLNDLLKAMIADGKSATPEFAEIQRRFGWEFNGMRLHEYYFENLKKGGNQDGKALVEKALSSNFQSFEIWEKSFRAAAAMRGIGWVVLYRDIQSGSLFNCWINEHDVGHLAGAQPILVIDVFEHAFMVDYGLKRADYIDAFFKNVDWSVVAARLK
jgi:Fe-Mn family superoxide dismutase